jgi:hypothetical protein
MIWTFQCAEEKATLLPQTRKWETMITVGKVYLAAVATSEEELLLLLSRMGKVSVVSLDIFVES